MLSPFSFRLRRWFYPLLGVVVALSIFVNSLQPSQALSWFDLIYQGIQVVQLSNVSDKQEVQLGQQINKQLVSEQIKIYSNSDVTRYIDQVGQRLAASSTRPNIPYKFQVVNADSINAFATMGGFVYVHSGLLKAADNEAQLASVMAHEIGHIANRHAVQQMRQKALASGLTAAAGLDRNAAVAIGVDLAIERPTSRQDEFEADRSGFVTLGRAGYDQSAMPAFLQKLLKAPSPPTFLSDHPATSDRIAVLKRELNPARANVGSGLNSAAYKSQIRPLLRQA